MNRLLRPLSSISLDVHLLLLLVLSMPALFPLLSPEYFYAAHDGRHTVFFTSMFDEAIQDGALWPRWAMHHNQGYGYPTFLVQAPLAFYLAEIFILFGAGITAAVKIVYAISFLASGWGLYSLIRHWADDGESSRARWAALCAGLLYVYLPYHLLDIYVRSALAETVMMAWFPWVVLAFDRLPRSRAQRSPFSRFSTASALLGALLLSHVLALIAFLPLLLLFVLYRLIRTQAGPAGWFWSAAAGIGGLSLAAIFWLPLFVEGPLLDQTVFTEQTYTYSRHWVYPAQLFSPFWGYGFSDDPVGANDGMGFQAGLVLLALGLCAPLLLRGSRYMDLGLFLLLSTVAVFFSVSPAAAPFWRLLSPLEVIQFPWRLLALSGFTLSALGGLLYLSLLERSDVEAEAGALLFVVLIVVASFDYARPESTQAVETWREDGRAVYRFEEEHADMLGYTRWVERPFTSSALSSGYEAEPFDPDALPRIEIVNGRGEVVTTLSRGHTFGGEVLLENPATVLVRVYFFPGWRATVDGQPVPIRPFGPDGLVALDLPQGRHEIQIRMGSTPVRSAGALVSALMLAFLGLGWLRERMGA